MRRILLKRRGLVHEPLGESFQLCRSLLILIAGDLDFVLRTEILSELVQVQLGVTNVFMHIMKET